VSRRDSLAVLALIALGLAYQLPLLQTGVGLIDEGHLANGARRLAAGEILYRDVYTVYPPASFHAVAWLFELFGTHLQVVRGFHVVLTLALALLVFAWARRLMETPFAWIAGALVAATGWHVILEGCHYAYLYGAIPMAGLLCLARADARGELERVPLLAVGAWAGLSLAFRLEPFVGLALAGAAVVTLREGIGARTLVRLLWLVLGTLAVIVPIGIYYAIQGALTELLLAVFWTSFGQYLEGGEFNLPMPSLEWTPAEWSRRGLRRMFVSWEFRIPVLLYGLTILEVARAQWRARRAPKPHPPLSPESLQRLALALLGLVLYLRATGRSDYYHLAPILFPAYLLGVDALARAWCRWIPVRFGGLAYPLVAIVLASSLSLHEFDRAVRRSLERSDEVALMPGGPYIARADQTDDLVAEVRRRTRPGEPIVVLPWYPIVYFLAERPNPTRYDWLFPGYLSTESAVSAFIEAIERSPAQVVVYSPISIDGLPDRSLEAFAPEIHRFLMKRFQPVRRYGRFWIMKRRPEAASAREPAAGAGPAANASAAHEEGA
jgi:hypothetical protein